MTSVLFEHVRNLAREYISYTVKKEIKAEEGIFHKFATIILEKTRRDLINSDTNEDGTLNIADHEITWNLKYYIYSEKIGGFENQIEPIPITKEMTKGLEKLTRTAKVSYNQEVFQKKTILSVYRIPDNFTSHKFLDEVHNLIIAPIWGDIKEEELVKSEISEPEDKNELINAIEKLDNWRIEDEKIVSNYSFNNNQITMEYIELISKISRQERNPVEISVLNNDVNLKLNEVKWKNYSTAQIINQNNIRARIYSNKKE